MITIMKDLQFYIKYAKSILEDLNIPYNDCNVSVNTRLAKTWGICHHREWHNGTWKHHWIELNKVLLLDTTSDDALMNTLLHEYLHTCPRCDNHKAVWQHYANMINSKYNYNIKRCTSSKEKGISVSDNFKYTVSCDNCGAEYGYSKHTKVVRIAEQHGSLTCPHCNRTHTDWSAKQNH